MKIRAKLFLLLVPLLLLSGLLINYLAGRAGCRTLHAETAERAGTTARHLVEMHIASFEAPSEQNLLPLLYEIATDLKAGQVGFADNSGTILAHTNVLRKGEKLSQANSAEYSPVDGKYQIKEHNPKGYLSVYTAVIKTLSDSAEELALREPGYKGKRLGTLLIDLSLKDSIAIEHKMARNIISILAVVYLLIFVAAFLLTEMALRPIHKLISGTERIRLGDYGFTIPVSTKDEFGDLAKSFNEMSSALSGTIVSKNYLDAIVDNVVDTLIVTDLHGIIGKVNKSARVLLDRGSRKLEGQGIMGFFPWDDREAGGWLGKLRKTGEVRDYEATLAAGPGITVPVLISASFIKDTEGNNSGIVAVVRDITLRKKHEAELARSNEELQRFAFVASHDLQEPLRTVSSYIQLLESKYRTVLGPEAERNVNFITDAVTRMRGLVRDLLDYSKINSARRLEEVETGEALDYVETMLRDAISAAGAVIERGNLPVILADRCQIERLFQNLLSNAVKFTNGGTPLIHVGAERSEGGWVFHVRDNGIGIEERHAGKLFKLFGRLHGNETPGAGIGLASCKKIVEHYGGQIWFESGPGKGTSFFFSIPNQTGKS
ncbi:MAG: hypothetical protein AUJ51_07700 [Elusimicrobia bacterium CG1_02_56_21]|nr:MAG: hypothetical protein AUJ51_07700 [Elusimicrobia bacterium CG1_02_56_21]